MKPEHRCRCKSIQNLKSTKLQDCIKAWVLFCLRFTKYRQNVWQNIQKIIIKNEKGENKSNIKNNNNNKKKTTTKKKKKKKKKNLVSFDMAMKSNLGYVLCHYHFLSFFFCAARCFCLCPSSRMPFQSSEGLSGYLLAIILILFENRLPWLGIFVNYSLSAMRSL